MLTSTILPQIDTFVSDSSIAGSKMPPVMPATPHKDDLEET